MEIKGHFVQVPPPSKPPVDELSAAYGLCDALRTTVSDHMYRCNNCSTMQPADTLMVWVPDGIRIGDPLWSVKERARLGAYNGSSSGWCVKCARLIGKSETCASVLQRIYRWITK